MSDNKNIQIAPVALGWRLWVAALGASFVALVVYSLTLAGYLFPDLSASLATQWMGMDAMKVPLHPIWGGLVKALGGASMGLRLNLLSMVCGVLSAGLLCGLVGYFVHQSTHNEDTVKLARGASLLSGIGASFVFIFSTAIWQSSTHLDYGMFDVFFALAVFSIFIPAIHWPKAMPYCTGLIAIGCGIGLAESVIFQTWY